MSCKNEEVGSIVSRLRSWVERQPDAAAYTFLSEGEVTAALTYSELDRRAHSIASALRAQFPADARLLLLYEPGLDFVEALWGCFYAGMVPVPASAPDVSALVRRTLPRLQAIARNCEASAVLSTAALQRAAHAALVDVAGVAALRWVATETIPALTQIPSAPIVHAGNKLALLQYTSGSTGAPRGVAITHGNLVANQRMILEAMPPLPGTPDIVAGWLPTYHYMGLIGNVIHTIYRGGQLVLMSPLDFVRRPLRWLQAISKYRATLSGGPNFAYDLCVQRITPEQVRALDLRSWRVAFSGAEPVQAGCIERFQQHFGAAGFRSDSFQPVYGLAEVTLLASGVRPPTRGARVRSFSASALAQHSVQLSNESSARRLVGCGGAPSEQKVVIVDPEACTPLPEDRVGEIWIAGPNVSTGYWGRPDLNAQCFNAVLRGDSTASYLRTGDLGFFCDGELFVTGRLKDMIIVRGRNHYPHDIEATAAAAHPALTPSGIAAFAVDSDAGELLVIMAELKPALLEGLDRQRIIAAIRDTVTQVHQISPECIVLAQPGTIAKTSSGKHQRGVCRDRFLAGNIKTEFVFIKPGSVLSGRNEPAREQRAAQPRVESET